MGCSGEDVLRDCSWMPQRTSWDAGMRLRAVQDSVRSEGIYSRAQSRERQRRLTPQTHPGHIWRTRPPVAGIAITSLVVASDAPRLIGWKVDNCRTKVDTLLHSNNTRSDATIIAFLVLILTCRNRDSLEDRPKTAPGAIARENYTPRNRSTGDRTTERFLSWLFHTGDSSSPNSSLSMI